MKKTLYTIFFLVFIGANLNAQTTDSQKKYAPIENMSNFNWEGTYVSGILNDDVGYTLIVSSPGPMRWTEFEWVMEVSGIQTFYKIKGYAIRDNAGNLEFHFIEKVEGAFYQEDKMDMNETMFKLSKTGKIFKTSNGKWNITDFVKSLTKK